MTGDEGAIAISQIVKESRMLEDFLCSSTRVGSEGGLALAEALGTCNNMKKLDLRDNMFGVEAGIALSQSIPVFVNLTEIYLSYLNLEDEDKAGARVLSQAVVGKPGFKLLNINGNFLSDEGVDNVKEIFKNFPSILGPMDEIDPEGEDYDDEEEEEDDDDTEDELESNLKDLEIKQDE
ncbi:Ran GTPase-activating protein 1 [Tanacetum coccineum]